MNHPTQKPNITALMPLMVFLLFSLCLLAVLLTGAGVYRDTVQQGEFQFERRTAVQYLTTRIRQADRPDCLALRAFGDTQALVIREEIGGKGYQTLVYCHDGFLRELFCAESGRFRPGDGEKVLPLQAMHVSVEDGLVQTVLTLPDGTCCRVIVQLRSGKEAAP